jgi:hypothetical protein
MNRFKYEAFLDEFPFLESLALGCAICKKISVKRVTRELLQKVPHYSGATGSLVGIDDSEVVHFILNDGTIIRDAVAQSGDVVHNEAHTDNEYWEGETILEALYRQEVSPMLAYIVIVHSGYIIQDHRSQPDWCATIYKPARDIDLGDLITQERDSALQQVKAEANF